MFAEKYYREQLMLLVSWTCETDILGSFESCQDRYTTLEMSVKEEEDSSSDSIH